MASHLWKVANESLSHKDVQLLFPIFVIAFMMTYSTPSHEIGRTASAAGQP